LGRDSASRNQASQPQGSKDRILERTPKRGLSLGWFYSGWRLWRTRERVFAWFFASTFVLIFAVPPVQKNMRQWTQDQHEPEKNSSQMPKVPSEQEKHAYRNKGNRTNRKRTSQLTENTRGRGMGSPIHPFSVLPGNN
jgi:hypothetical protein